MKFDFTPVFVAFGIGLATYLVLRIRKVTPDVKFKDVRYIKNKNEIQLVVENVSDKRVWVKPALRVVRLTPAEEWKEKTLNGGVPMMTASAGSVIKGYDLIGEYAVSVPVEPHATYTLTYPVMRDFHLKAYDDIKVDSLVGESQEKLEGSVTATVRMNLSEFLNEERHEDMLLELLNETSLHKTIEAVAQANETGMASASNILARVDGGIIEPSAPTSASEPAVLDVDGGTLTQVSPTQPSLDGGIVSESEPQAPRAREGPALSVEKSGFPLQALCYCCGKERWLSWVVEGSHVCAECKEFLAKDKTLVGGLVGGIDLEEDMESPEGGVELIGMGAADLKPRHKKILDVLLAESTLSVKELSMKLERDEKAVATDLRYLLKNNLVDRVKIKGRYKYFSLREDDRVLIHDADGTVLAHLDCT